MSLQKYFIRRAFLSKTKPKGFSNVANPKPALNLNEHINDVVVESQSYSVTLDTTGPVSVTSGTTTTVNGGTGAQIIATTGELDLTSTAANVDINAATGITMDTAAGDIEITAATGNLYVTASGATKSIGLYTDFNTLFMGPNNAFLAAAGPLSLETGAGNDIFLNPGVGGKVRMVNVPTYADDAAAGVGGLTIGMVYKQATGELMIKL